MGRHRFTETSSRAGGREPGHVPGAPGQGAIGSSWRILERGIGTAESLHFFYSS